jgi:hypothetical protein
MKRIVLLGLILIGALAFTSCSKEWIDEVPSTATLRVTASQPAVHHWYGETQYASYTLSNGISDNVSGDPAYAGFLLSLDGKEVKYKIRYRRMFDGDSYYYLRLYRDEVFMDFSISAKIERGPKKE